MVVGLHEVKVKLEKTSSWWEELNGKVKENQKKMEVLTFSFSKVFFSTFTFHIYVALFELS